MFNKKLWKRKTMNNYKKLESGRSMIEMLGVLAIIGVLSVGGIAGYSKAMNKFKTNKVADNVSMIVTNIRTLYAQQKTYDGLDNKNAVAMGVVPDELIKDAANGTLTNAFLGSVEIKAADVKGADASADGTDMGFTVRFSGLTKEACVTLATNDWGSGYSAGFVGMKVAGTADAAAEAASNADNLNVSGACTATALDSAAGKAIACAGAPMNVAVAAKACSCTNSSNVCEILWKFY